jgi:hypothetical protein
MSICIRRWTPFCAIVMHQQLIMKLFGGSKGRAGPSVGICEILTSGPFRGMRERMEPSNQFSRRAVESCHSGCLRRRDAQAAHMVWQFDNHAAPLQYALG